jgi:hypothetical protein
MTKSDEQSTEAARDGSTKEGGVGDVETAGETTAAATVGGPSHTKPVGADTMVKVADTSSPAEPDGD